jgi:hypothetical protein
MRRSRILTAVTALTVASAAALVPATAAHAASGLGWSASWNYYLDDTYFFNMTLPGAQLVGHVLDDNGTRIAGVSVADTAVDGVCVVAATGGEIGGHRDQMVCDGQPHVTFSLQFLGAHLLSLLVPSPVGERLITMVIPSSANDPEMRQVGTGASWSYYTDRDYQFSVQRQGVRLTGFGNDSVAVGTVEHTGDASTCADGHLFDLSGSGTVDSGRTCDPGGFDTIALFNVRGDFLAEACVIPPSRCLDIRVARPS